MDLPQFQLAGTVSGQTAFDKFVRLAALSGGEEAEDRKLEEVEGTENEWSGKRRRRNVR